MALLAQIMLPNDKERQQIFYWLKQVSSWSAWNRILGYYREWLKVSESSVREASIRNWDRRTGVPESDYRLILKGFAHCGEGVRRLRTGDKRVFKYDANGEFVMAHRAPDHWTLLLMHIKDGETGIDEDHTPYWPEFKHALTQLGQAWGECSGDIIESDDVNDPASNIYGVWFQKNLPEMNFPANLPDVPDPTDEILVKTGKRIPCSGIWEPVEVTESKGFSLFRGAPTPKGPFPIIGCMNYLHEGSSAPKAKQETARESLRNNVTWRLLWRDDRYIDGAIPAEESDYIFRMPEAPSTEQIAQGTSGNDSMIVAETGQKAPISGRWLAEQDLHASITIAQGEPMPKHQGHSIRWVLAEAKNYPTQT